MKRTVTIVSHGEPTQEALARIYRKFLEQKDRENKANDNKDNN